jgi:hypothetical protein
MLGLGLGLTLQNSAARSSAELLSVPTGFPWTPPVGIYKNGNRYFVDPEFDLQTHANISVTKTYYVDSATGSDSNDGLTALTPFKTMLKVNTQGDADRVIVADGSYFYRNQRSLEIARNLEVICDGQFHYTADVTNIWGTFTNTTNYWQASSAEFVARVKDYTNLDAFGNPILLTSVASIALVNSTPNSFFWSSGQVYIRTFDSREPDTDIKGYENLAFRFREDNMKQYWKGVVFDGSAQIYNDTSTGGAKFYIENGTTLRNFEVWGIDEFISKTCFWNGDEDGINYDARLTKVTNALEIDSTGTNHLRGSSSGQGSTSHNGCNIVRVQCYYFSTSGQNCADVNSGYTWMLGGNLNTSTINVGLYFSINEAWLDGVEVKTNTTSIQIAGSCVVNHRNLRLSGTVDVGGSATYRAY